MAADAHFQIDLTGTALGLLQQMSGEVTTVAKKVDNLEKNAKNSFSGIAGSLKAINFVSITQGLQNFNQTLRDINAPAMDFESSLADLSAITGLVGNDLDFIGDKARDNALKFGGDAAQSVEVYKLLLSQLGPELANTPDVLALMADKVSVLSKTMGGNTPGAAEVLTTAMNQYGISLKNPIEASAELDRIMNSMAAGAKSGSAELPALKDAIQAVGGDARASEVKFEGMVSALEALDKAGKKNREGGIALRNVLTSLNQGRFLPEDVQKEFALAGVDIERLGDKSLSLTDRLRGLNPIINDAALLSKFFGRETQLAGAALIGSVDAQDEMTKAITGTNTAQEQAAIIMDTNREKQNRLNAFFSDLKIGIGNVTGAFGVYVGAGVNVLQGLSTIAPAVVVLGNAYNFLALAQNREMLVKKAGLVWSGVVTAAQWLWNTSLFAGATAMQLLMSPVTLVIAGIGLLVGGVILAYNHFEGFRNVINDLGTGIYNFIASNPMLSWITGVIDKIKIAYDWVMDFLGSLFSSDGAEISVNTRDNSASSPLVGTENSALDLGIGSSTTPGTSASGSGGGSSFSGAEKKNVNVTIENLVKNITISSTNLKEGSGEIRKQVEQALVGAVRDFEVAI